MKMTALDVIRRIDPGFWPYASGAIFFTVAVSFMAALLITNYSPPRPASAENAFFIRSEDGISPGELTKMTPRCLEKLLQQTSYMLRQNHFMLWPKQLSPTMQILCGVQNQ